MDRAHGFDEAFQYWWELLDRDPEAAGVLNIAELILRQAYRERQTQ